MERTLCCLIKVATFRISQLARFSLTTPVYALKLLEMRGHTVEQHQTMGSTQSIMLRDGYMYGSSDPRRPGAATLGVDVLTRP
ncbi:MAG: gamma-glutamyltranspeptidase [Arenicella sp.]|jgi:gamma-glutamyltranspeptidase